ncbi:MAG: CNNM domain-containing protein [Verrucomicrobiaceae bacterium]|nr:CNNM domain-containing protein [Verrucomicrobiaceae bacterium]
MIWLALILALVLSFLFSGIESAIMSISRVRVRHAADEGDSRAARLLPLIEDRDALLGAATVVNHMANLAAFSIINWKLIQALGTWGYAVGLLIALPVFLIGLEVVPKTIFRRYPFRLLRYLHPLVLIAGMLRVPFKVIRGKQPADSGAQSESSARDDLKNLTASLAKQGLLTPAGAALIARVLDYKRWKTGDLMVPLTKTAAVPPDIAVNDALKLAAEGGLVAIPVMGPDGGFAGILELLALPARLPPDRLVRQHMRAAVETAATTSALAALQRLRQRGRTLAIVNDGATGKPVGIIAEENLLAPLLRR